MIIVTSGSRYIDIDAYACIVAYAELLRLLGKDAKAVSTATLNESITPSLRALPVEMAADYASQPDDTYILTDLSEPAYFDKIVNQDQVVEIFDHHPGFEAYWADKLGKDSHIEFIGAAATLIYEQWQQAGKLNEMGPSSASLLAAAILDNTLNFGANVTTDRDKVAYEFLSEHASLDKSWIANYFSECQQDIVADIPEALRNDTKFITFAGQDEVFCVGQMVVWDANPIMTSDLNSIVTTLGGIQPEWFANIVSISEGHSYFLSENKKVQQWLQNLLGVTFDGQIAQADRLWLRKEIMKAAEERPQLL